jgi:DHA1 family tetracycline resistance protein-like MFS transporter
MKSSKKTQLGIIFLTILINMVGFGIVIPVLPFYASEFGAKPFEIGWLFGIYSLVQFVFSPFIGQISDRFGRRPVLILSTLGTAVGFLVMGFSTTLAMLFAGRIIDGISGGSVGTAQAYIADITGPEERSKAMGLIGAAFGLGFIFGPALGGLMAANFGHAAPMHTAGVLAIINAVLIFILLPESLSKAQRERLPKEKLFPGIFRHTRTAAYFTCVSTYFMLITGFSIMTAVFAMFVANRHGFDEKQTGYLYAMLGIIGVFIQGGLIGRLVKRFGEGRVATVGAMLLTTGLLFAPLVSGLGALLLACAAIAAGNSLTNPTISGITSQCVDADWQGRALGVLQSSASLARFLGPVIGGWLLQLDLANDPSNYAKSPLWAAAAVLFVTFLLCLRLPSFKKTPSRT